MIEGFNRAFETAVRAACGRVAITLATFDELKGFANQGIAPSITSGAGKYVLSCF